MPIIDLFGGAASLITWLCILTVKIAKINATASTVLGA
jgi:hypothetical protein